MKALKGFAFVLLMLLTVLFLIYFQIYNAVNSTVLSESYINGSMEKNGAGNFLSAYMKFKVNESSLTDNIEFNGIKLNDFNNRIINSLEPKWLDKELEQTARGVYSYISAEAERLPVVDIEPVKTAFVNTAVEQLLGKKEVKLALAGVKTAAVLLKGPYKSLINNGLINGIFLDSILKKPEIQALGIDREMLSKAIGKYSGISNVRADTSKIDREIVKGLVVEYLEVDKISNSLDLNTLFEKAYIDTKNPLTSIRNTISSFKAVNLRILVIAAIILLIPLLIAVKPLAFYKGMLLSGMLAGAAGLVTGAFGKYSSFARKSIKEAVAASRLGLEQENLDILGGWLEHILKGYFNVLLSKGMLIFGICLILFAAVTLTGKKINSKVHSDTDSAVVQKTAAGGSSGLKAVRLISAYLLILAVLLNTWLSVSGFIKELQKEGPLKAEESMTGRVDFKGALADTINAGFLKEMK